MLLGSVNLDLGDDMQFLYNKHLLLQISISTVCRQPCSIMQAQEARRLGGQRRKKEVMLAGAYDLEGLDNIPGIRRV
jgi:hypothetical protein